MVQFNSEYIDDGEATPEAYVWGYRFDGEPSAEQMIRDIASASRDLDVMLQYTGEMGCTFCGAGLSYDHSVIDEIGYDFEGARNDNKVTFQWFGEGRPGYNAPLLCEEAIENARTSHIIEHPLNAYTYSYPAYDYDYWGSDDLWLFCVDDNMWQAGWYDGYWSVWTGGENLRRLVYSGLGISSLKLTDGSVIGLSFVPLDRKEDLAGTDMPSRAIDKPLNYNHFDFEDIEDPGESSIDIIDVKHSGTCKFYNLTGQEISNPSAGVYIRRNGQKVEKIFIP